jgi:dienelactone hydrolase
MWHWISAIATATCLLGATVAMAAERSVTFVSATPRSYEDIIRRRPMPPVTLQARLYVPRRQGRVPAVIIVPGSGGVSSSMVTHANALNEAGLAVLLIDPFGGRGVRDTIADQDQIPFAASTYDIFAAMRALEREPDIDSSRIGAMGYSRGGLAVLQAALTPVASSALGPGKALRAVLSGWPWCGVQFAAPHTAPTAVRFVVAESDNWVAPAQCQAYQRAMEAHNPAVSLRSFRNADHGFGYSLSPQELPNAVKAFGAPIIYFDERGTPRDPRSGQPLPGADERTVAEMLRPYLSRGARVGSRGNQMAEFMADFVGFFRAQLLH